MSTKLSEKKCLPCEGIGSAYSPDEVQSKMPELHSDWQLASRSTCIYREFKFKNFVEALSFTNKVGEIAESENHHPDIVLKWGFVRIDLWTHALGGLTENDFIVAAKIDTLN